MRKDLAFGLVVLAGLVAAPSLAADERGVRLGIGLGEDVLRSDVTSGAITAFTKGDRLGFSVFGGYTFNKWLAAEVAYRGGGSDFGDSGVSTDIRAFEASGVGSWWITPSFSVYGRLGLYAYRSETDVNGSVTKSDGTEPIFGVGLQTEFDGALVRLEYQMVETGDVNLNTGVGTAVARNNELTSWQLSIVWLLHD